MDLKLGILALTVIFTAGLAAVVFIRNPRGEVQRSFLYLITSFIVWSLFVMAVYLSHGNLSLTILTRLTTVASLIVALLFLNFCYRFPNVIAVNRGILSVFIPITLADIMIVILPNGAYRVVTEGAAGKIFIINTLPFFLHTLIIMAIFSSAYWLLFKKRKTYSGINRKLIDLVLIAAALPIVAGIVLNLFFLDRSVNDSYIYGPSFTLIFTLLVTYKIFIRGEK